MKSSRRWLLIIAVELVLVCVCFGIVGALAAGGWFYGQNAQSAQLPPTPTPQLSTPTRVPTWTPTATETPAPTYTLVVQPLPPGSTVVPLVVASRTPTTQPGAYDVVVPVPTAPRIVYPITFSGDLNVITYDVTGTTFSALSDSLNAQAIADPNETSGRYYAQTEWHLAAQWSYQPTDRGCEVENGSVTLAMTMTLPILSSTAGVPRDVQDRWMTFITNTITHEKGHVKLNLLDARNYQGKLGNFPPAADCTTIKQQLNDLFNNATGTIRRDNINYDAQTQHGETQGAVFP